MIDPQNPQQLDRLYRAVDWSRYRLQPFRRRRMEILKEFVGFWYSETGADDRVPVNLLQLAMTVYQRQLVPSAPRCMVTALDPSLKPVAADMEAWMDRAAVGMSLVETLRTFVFDAIISVGVLKVGEALAGEMTVQGTTQFYGQPFCERVDLDDWVHDITARRLDQCEYMGNRYRVPLEEAKENPAFDKKARERLSAMTRFAYNERGDLRSSTLSQSTLQWIDEYQDHVELWDLFLPREKLVLTVPYMESMEGGFSGPPLRIQEWKGPRKGPYHLLGFGDVPNNVMPASPAQNLMDLHLLANRLWRKLGRQADREKTVLGVAGPNTEDGDRIVRANDGETIRIDRPDSAREYHFGGVDNNQHLFAHSVRDEFNMQAGNIEAMAGLGPQAHTLGQDQMLKQSESAQIGEMQDRCVQAFSEVYADLGFWWWTNPHLTYSAGREAHGVEVPVNIPPQARQAPFESLDFKLDPYSLQDDSPQARGNKLVQTVQTLILPIAPVLAQQGLQVQWPELFALLGKYLNVPDLGTVLKQGPPPAMAGAVGMAQGAAQGAGPGAPDQPPMPAATVRTHIRRNTGSGVTNQGQRRVMQQLLAGGGSAQQRGMVRRAAG